VEVQSYDWSESPLAVGIKKLTVWIDISRHRISQASRFLMDNMQQQTIADHELKHYLNREARSSAYQSLFGLPQNEELVNERHTTLFDPHVNGALRFNRFRRGSPCECH
jgi:hypothetical protein